MEAMYTMCNRYMTLERKGNVFLVLFLLYGGDVNELTEELRSWTIWRKCHSRVTSNNTERVQDSNSMDVPISTLDL